MKVNFLIWIFNKKILFFHVMHGALNNAKIWKTNNFLCWENGNFVISLSLVFPHYFHLRERDWANNTKPLAKQQQRRTTSEQWDRFNIIVMCVFFWINMPSQRLPLPSFEIKKPSLFIIWFASCFSHFLSYKRKKNIDGIFTRFFACVCVWETTNC